MIRHIPALIRHRRQTMLATSALAWGMAAIPVAHAQTPTPINETPIVETSPPQRSNSARFMCADRRQQMLSIR
ncbi:hypothetical protein GFGA_1c0849 [Gluconobacter frateurii NBRC 103465]|nr:hypothetical protein GFGA_1c0849 [Gluconobacter frateurii NBRC 103465]